MSYIRTDKRNQNINIYTTVLAAPSPATKLGLSPCCSRSDIHHKFGTYTLLFPARPIRLGDRVFQGGFLEILFEGRVR